LAMPGWSAHRPAHGGDLAHAGRRRHFRGGRLFGDDARDAVAMLWAPPSGFSGERGPGCAPETPQKWVNGNRTETHQREVSSRNFNGLADGNFFREQGVGSSNLPAPTNNLNNLARRASRCAPETAPETQGARRMAPRAMSGFAPEFVAAFQCPRRRPRGVSRRRGRTQYAPEPAPRGSAGSRSQMIRMKRASGRVAIQSWRVKLMAPRGSAAATAAGRGV